MDLDHFKKLNDTFGHEAGNICLKKISQILRSKFRVSDIIARFGGDEFEILLPDASTDKCLAIAKDLIQKIENEDFHSKISCTIGIANFPSNAQDSQSLFLAADQALYLGKKNGRGRAIVSDIASKTILTNNQKLNDLNSLGLIEPIPKKVSFPENIKKDVQRIDGLDIINRIASSSNGEVMLAKQHELDRFVALKRPLTEHLTEEQSNAFKKEAFITASLSHPGVVPLYTMGRGLDGRLYYTMKPIKGTSLAEILEKWKSKDSQYIKDYNLIKLIHILLKASETVAYAHNKNIAHLDIHPNNIIVGEFGEITLIDWGKGINLGEHNRANQASRVYISGSPIYRPPEQLANDNVGTFTDVYSLGIILFEILTDKTPFQKNSTKETVEAIAKGIEFTNENKYLNHGIDPLLSNVCRQAIQKDPHLRITANDFVKTLSRYVMLEVDLKVYNFNTSENPLLLEDWHPFNSQTIWKIDSGVLSPISEIVENTIYWKTPITGNFSFTYEGWVTKENRELAVICYGKSIKEKTGWNIRKDKYKGYCFQFGADNNLYSKLVRHADDILINSKFTIEVNRKYLITISFQDGWLHCFIDKMLVFSYRELHPFIGHHIGFYSFLTGSHFRPIEIRYQTTGLLIPAIRLADEHLTYNRFEVAISHYNEIIKNFPDRLEGYESLLKRGNCYIKLGKYTEALNSFNRLKGTILEPYALTEIALMELPTSEYEVFHKDGSYKKAYELFKQVTERFPNHQAIYRILNPCFLLRYVYDSNSITYKKNREESILYKMELQKIALETSMPPGQTQIICFGSMICHMMLLGKWQEGLDYFKLYATKYRKYLISSSRNNDDFYQICYSCDETFVFEEVFGQNFDKAFIFRLHPLIIVEKFNKRDDVYDFIKSATSDIFRNASYQIIIKLSTGQHINVKELFSNYFLNKRLYHDILARMRQIDYFPFEMLLSNDKKYQYQEDISHFLQDFAKESNEHVDESKNLNSYFKAIEDLFEFNMSNCLFNINDSNNLATKIAPLHEKRLLLTCLLYSLEYYGDLTKEELIFQNKIYLTGLRLELATNFLKGEVFTLSEKWPKKPTNYFFDRVLYAIWLHEKNEFQLVSNVINNLINPLLGDSYFQPFLKKLQEKNNGKLTK